MAHAVPQRFESTRVMLHTSVVAALVSVAFVYMRYLDGRPAFLLPSQVLYVVPLVVGLTLSIRAGFMCAPASHGRRAWLFVGAINGLLLTSEAVYSLRVLRGEHPAGAAGSLADIAAGAAIVAFFALAVLIARLDRLDRNAAARLILDSVSIGIVGFVIVFRVVAYLLGRSGHGVIDTAEAVRLAVYPAFGLLLVITTLVLVVSARNKASAAGMMVGVAAAFIGLGTLMWPFWGLASVSGVSRMLETIAPTAFLIGYVFMAGGAVVKLRSGDRQLRVAPPTLKTGWTLSSIAASTVVFAAVIALSVEAVFVPGTGESIVYLGSMVAASVCMVARAGFASAEAVALQHVVHTDDVTGASSRDHLLQRLEELTLFSKRFGERFAVVALDLNDFGAYNRRYGRLAGDEALAAVADRLIEQVGADSLFRVGDDEFVLVLTAHHGVDLNAITREAALAVGRAATRAPLSASVGYAVCPDHGTEAARLLARAQAAQIWVKNRRSPVAAAYDESVMLSHADISPSSRSLRRDMVRALSAAMDARDPANHAHAHNVAALSGLLGRAAGLDEENVASLQVAALLHDVGKLALPDEMLSGRTLSIRQRRLAEEHADLGGRLVEALGVPEVVAWVRGHHERWDGRGYPDGLAADAIPLEARIIALADAFDGMTTGKRYGAPMSKGAALQEIDLGIGGRFDPGLAETFISVVAATDALGWEDGWTA